MIMTVLFLRMVLHFSQIGFTDGLTFIRNPSLPDYFNQQSALYQYRNEYIKLIYVYSILFYNDISIDNHWKSAMNTGSCLFRITIKKAATMATSYACTFLSCAVHGPTEPQIEFSKGRATHKGEIPLCTTHPPISNRKD